MGRYPEIFVEQNDGQGLGLVKKIRYFIQMLPDQKD